MEPITFIMVMLLLVVSAVAGYYYYQTKITEKTSKPSTLSELEAIEKASDIAKKKLIEAEEKASEIEKQARDQVIKKQAQIKEEEKLLNDRERKILDRSNLLDKRFDELEVKEKQIEQGQKKIKEKSDELKSQLEKIASLTKKEAEELLKKEVEEELVDWKAKKIKENEMLIKNEVDDKSKQILIDTMLSSAVDYVSDTTTTTVNFDDEELKRRIIGKGGRNIKTLEKLTGVDVIVDESPNEVTVSCFDPIRREVAALALKYLLKSGKINPVTIEETVNKVKKEILKEIKQTGEEMAFETGFNDLPTEIVMLLGRFKYRFSYGQNLVKHTLEMVKIGEQLAQELNANVRITKLACLLHDLGKVAPQEGKQHHHISAEIAEKHFKDKKLVNAIAAHHFDIEAESIEAEIVRVADAISGSRPGARRDSYEDYIKRIRALEDIAYKQAGVKEAFAIQAGREVRVIVKPDEVDDEKTQVMAYEIAKEIEATQNYPGIVKVNVIREYRATEEAK